MNKNAIKKFAIEARKKLLDSVTDKAGMLGITKESCSEPITKGPDFEVYQTVVGTEVTLNKRQGEQRRRLVSQIESRGFEAVVEEVAYTWFNRICAIRFMEVNDYLPNRVRVLSSEKEGKMEPDFVTQAPDVDLDLTVQEKEEIINWKMSGTSEDTDRLYCKLFLKQCHQLHDILPGLFEADSDYMELLFGISYTNKDDVIYMLVNPETGIPEADFNVSTLDEEGNPTGQVEIIGWLYQYYNTELKDDTFAKLKKNVKISKDRIPAATQLFTPDWIVRYMVENSVGRIWIEHLRAVDPSTDEKATAERFGWKYYLPEAEQEESVNVKLAEIRTTYKDLKPTDITCIDPCMGSGHILIAMFDVLMDIYESAGYDKREAAFEIVEHNIHGLDIDQRAYQLAYFAVMMKARQYNRRIFSRNIQTNVYSFQESQEINRNHLKLFGLTLDNKQKEQAKNDILYILDKMQNGKEFGSLLNIKDCEWNVLYRWIEDLEIGGQLTFDAVGSETTQLKLRKIIRICEVLSNRYHVVCTNPPYMGNASAKLTNYLQDIYPDAKYDTYAAFIEKANQMVDSGCFVAMVTGESWMFLPSFVNMRKSFLCSRDIVSMAHFGFGAFENGFGTTSFILRKGFHTGYKSTFMRLVDERVDSEKKRILCNIMSNKSNMYICCQEDFNMIEGSPFVYWMNRDVLETFENSNLGDFAETKSGIVTGNNDFFMKLWYEVSYDQITFDSNTGVTNLPKYAPAHKGGGNCRYYGNLNYVMRLNDLWKPSLAKSNMRRGNQDYYFLEGLTWSTLSNQLAFRYSPKGFVYETKGSMCFINSGENIYYVLGLLNSSLCDYIMNILSPTLDFNRGSLLKMPYIHSKEKEKEIIELTKQCVELAQEDWDANETSWNFKKHPLV